jgi:hypothetical protein
MASSELIRKSLTVLIILIPQRNPSDKASSLNPLVRMLSKVSWLRLLVVRMMSKVIWAKVASGLHDVQGNLG